MATTRRRARTEEGQFMADDPATPEQNEAFEEPDAADQPLSVASLADFLGDKHPDREQLTQALAVAKAAAETFLGAPVGDAAPHNIRHGVHLLASHLLLTDASLDEPPTDGEIPLVIRYFWRTADAGCQPI